MSNHVITANEDASLNEIASLLEKHHIKRVPILKDGKLVEVVSRSNLGGVDEFDQAEACGEADD